jgi:hypothetical protein
MRIGYSDECFCMHCTGVRKQLQEDKSMWEISCESKLLEDGRGGLFINGELVETFDTEEQSDSAALLIVRRLIVDGHAEQSGQAYKDEKPIDLFDMRIR